MESCYVSSAHCALPICWIFAGIFNLKFKKKHDFYTRTASFSIAIKIKPRSQNVSKEVNTVFPTKAGCFVNEKLYPQIIRKTSNIRLCKSVKVAEKVERCIKAHFCENRVEISFLQPPKSNYCWASLEMRRLHADNCLQNKNFLTTTLSESVTKTSIRHLATKMRWVLSLKKVWSPEKFLEI